MMRMGKTKKMTMTISFREAHPRDRQGIWVRLLADLSRLAKPRTVEWQCNNISIWIMVMFCLANGPNTSGHTLYNISSSISSPKPKGYPG